MLIGRALTPHGHPSAEFAGEAVQQPAQAAFEVVVLLARRAAVQHPREVGKVAAGHQLPQVGQEELALAGAGGVAFPDLPDGEAGAVVGDRGQEPPLAGQVGIQAGEGGDRLLDCGAACSGPPGRARNAG